MKRTLSVLLIAGILFSLLSGCRVSAPGTDLPILEAGSLMAHTSAYAPFRLGESGADDPPETVLSSNDPETAALFANAYGFSEDQWEDFATYRGTGMSAYEITVFRMADEDTAEAGEAILADYLTARVGDFFGYAPAQAELVQNGRVVREDRYLAVLICEDVDVAADGFSKWVKAGLEGLDLNNTPEPPETVENAAQLLDYLLACCAFDLSQIDDLEKPEGDALASYLQDNYGLEGNQWTNAALAYSPTSPFVLAVIRPASLTTLQTMRFFKGMDAWLNTREDNATGESDPRLTNAFCCAVGNYALLLSCDDPEGLAQSARQALKAESLKKSDRHPEEVLPDDGLELKDLLFRLLVEYACPDWGNIEDKGWSSAENNSATAHVSEEIRYTTGVPDKLYQSAVVARWRTTSTPNENWYNLSDAKGFLVLFRCPNEDRSQQVLDKVQDALPAMGKRHVGTDIAVRVARSERYVLLVASPTAEDAVVAFPAAITSDSTRGFFMDFVNSNNNNNNTRPKGDPDPNFPDRVKYTPPGDEDMTVYDTTAILAAWEKGDPSSLSDYNRAIYDAAEALLDQLLTDGMTDLEKETALYTWITDNIIYDWKHTSLVGEAAREAYTPYGPLVNGSAVCLGYASGLQLLCEMADLEAVLVVGAGSNSTAAHAWNVIKIDGKWNCVDVTWDANGREQLGKSYQYRYFNITSDKMAWDHQWDYLNVPEAE